MNNALTLDYWFNLRPFFFSGIFATAVLVFFAAVTIAGIAAFIVGYKSKKDKWNKRIWNKAGWLATTMGLAGLLHYFFSYEQVPLFSMRFWLIIWSLGTLGWAYAIYRFAAVTVAEKRSQTEQRNAQDKWLPKAK